MSGLASNFRLGLLCAVLLLCGVVAFVGIVPRPSEPFSASQGLGAIQVLGGPDELWCFVEVDRVVYNPDRLASPTTFSLGHFQEVVVLSESGDVRRIPVSIPEGVTFHPNIARILRVGDDFYLYQGFSMNTHRSVFKWQTDHFTLLPLGESEEFLRNHGMGNLDPWDSEIDQIPLSDGWERVYHDRGWTAEPDFVWHGTTYELDDHKTGSLSLHRVDGEPWTVELVTWDPTRKPITREERDAISDRMQRGHPW